MTYEVAGRTVEISSPDKVMYPDAGVTKADVADYYRDVAAVMLSHVESRPITMHRFPDGIEEPGFYQQDAPDYFPDWVRVEKMEKKDGTVDRVVVTDAATLVYLSGQACLTPHIWQSRIDRPDRPDRVVFDLDPPEGSGADAVREAARKVRDRAEALDLECLLMTTGSTGYHVVLPIERRWDFDEVRDFARQFASDLAGQNPDRLTVAQRKDARDGRVFVDYLRNAYGQTTVAPYALRALPGAPVATPIDWDELGSTDPRSHDIASVRRRLGQRDDPWADYHPNRLERVLETLERLRNDRNGKFR